MTTLFPIVYRSYTSVFTVINLVTKLEVNTYYSLHIRKYIIILLCNLKHVILEWDIIISKYYDKKLYLKNKYCSYNV